MFDGEFASLKAIEETKTIRVPKPHGVFKNGSEFLIVMEHLDLSYSSTQVELGTKLAKLHLNNIQKGHNEDSSYVSKFGFDIPTCCGSIPQKNTWTDSWTDFYTSKLQEQINLIGQDSEVDKLWPKLREKIPHFFVFYCLYDF